MNAHYERAALLFEQERFVEAEREVRRALKHDPVCAFSLGLLALCCSAHDRFDEAESVAQLAISHAPNHAWTHYALAMVLTDRRDLLRADSALSAALALDPQNADYLLVKARICGLRSEWRGILAAADEALECNPQHVAALNLRSIAMQMLGKAPAARNDLRETLRVAPEDAMAHATMGWSQLELGQLTQANRSFREALRIAPNLEFARQGILQCLKLRVPLYRSVLVVAYLVMRGSARSRCATAYAALLGLLISNAAYDVMPAFGGLLALASTIYLLSAFASWFVTPLSNALLCAHPIGRLALTTYERREAAAVGGLGLLTAALLLCTGFVDIALFGPLTLASWVATCCVTAAMRFRDPRPRRWMLAYAGLSLAFGVAYLLHAFAGHRIATVAPFAAVATLERAAELFPFAPVGAFFGGVTLAAATWRR